MEKEKVIPKRGEAEWYFCTDCRPTWKFIGEFNELFYLVFDEYAGTYRIGDIKGHADTVYDFPVKPTKDVLNLVEEPEEDNDPRWDEQGVWVDLVLSNEKTFRFDPKTGYDIYDAFTKGGWKQTTHGHLYLYVVHTAAVLIEKYEQGITQVYPDIIGE